MSLVETAVDFFEKIEQARWQEVADLLIEDFKYFGPFPEPVGRDTWLSVMASLRLAFPDWSFNLQNVREEGDTVRSTIRITGTHTEELDLSPIGLPSIPATSIHFELPDENARILFKANKILELHVNPDIHRELLKVLSSLQID